MIPSGGQDTETIHGTQKPVECMRRPMLNNSSAGQAIYEPFLGSGTTLIAAQSSGPICFAIELDPPYVGVAIKRWQAFTGERVTLIAIMGYRWVISRGGTNAGLRCFLCAMHMKVDQNQFQMDGDRLTHTPTGAVFWLGDKGIVNCKLGETELAS